MLPNNRAIGGDETDGKEAASALDSALRRDHCGE
jgi:hypothetical protein